MPSPFLYFAGDRLSEAELSAARLDGHVVELGEGYIPADAVETRELRAGSLTELVGSSLAATHLSAAWIYGALPSAPARHTVQRAVPRRLHTIIDRRLRYRDLQVAERDLLRIGGVWVTTPERTLADLSRVRDDEHARAAVLLADSDPTLAESALRWLDCAGALPHKRSAHAFLRGLAARDAVSSADDGPPFRTR